MTPSDVRDSIQRCRSRLDDAMRAASVPAPDGDAATGALRACADECDRTIAAMVSDRLGGSEWE